MSTTARRLSLAALAAVPLGGAAHAGQDQPIDSYPAGHGYGAHDAGKTGRLPPPPSFDATPTGRRTSHRGTASPRSAATGAKSGTRSGGEGSR